MSQLPIHSSFFFFNDTATTEIYTLSLHDALPIYHPRHGHLAGALLHPEQVQLHGRGDRYDGGGGGLDGIADGQDRKSTRLNSSHSQISYAVFCFKKKKNN